MRHHHDLPHAAAATLTRQDLIRFELVLRDTLREFFSFKSYSLYFPQTLPEDMRGQDSHVLALIPAGENKLLLPLLLGEEFLGVFMARGISAKAVRPLARKLPRVAGLCLEKLFLHKLAGADPLTGLASEARFVQALDREIEVVRNCIRPSTAGPECAMPAYRACLGVLMARVNGLKRIQRKYGYHFAERLQKGLAETLSRVTPETCVLGRYESDSFAALLPEASAGACRKQAEALRQAVGELTFIHELTEEPLKISVSLGFANFPQDMAGALFEKPTSEQARILLDKASRAALAARDQGTGGSGGSGGPGPIFSFGRILSEGGKVLDTLPMRRLTVNLGRGVDAREGQRFQVWSGEGDAGQAAAEARESREARDGEESGREPYPAMYKGEIMLMEALEDHSLAEILHLADPGWSIREGDRLTLLKENLAPTRLPGEPGEERRDMVTGLFSYRDFLDHWSKAREECERFTLVMTRLGPGQGDEAAHFHRRVDQIMGEAAGLCREIFGEACPGARYSFNTLLFFHPGLGEAQTLALYADLAQVLERRLGAETTTAAACHPFLSFVKADALENCRKTMDYALLLPKPRIAAFNSMAQTISADRLFSQGDLYGAIEEYKLALLADENNLLAQNSLGVSEARLGRPEQAQRRFETVLSRDKKNLMALYNLGHTCQKLGEPAKARKAFRRCLALDPENIYCLIRLGQLAEREGRLAQAAKHYDQAAALEGGFGMTRRYLARLALKRDRIEEAREALHQALAHDPKDAFSLHLLAKLCLDSGEDPEIAELFARQSVALRPEQKNFWLELSRAFEARGKVREAYDALAKAQGL